MKLSGWITPKVTGDYYFYLASDDASQFWLSSDATEALLEPKAEEYGCCKGFLEPGAGQTSTPISSNGRQEIRRADSIEGRGRRGLCLRGDAVDQRDEPGRLVAALGQHHGQLDGRSDGSLPVHHPTTGLEVDPGKRHQRDVLGGNHSRNAVWQVHQHYGADSNGRRDRSGRDKEPSWTLSIQWFTNGTEVAGANSATYTIAWPKKAQDGMKVKCYTAVPGIPLYSTEATLTVTADTIAPTVVSAKADSSFVTVLLKFSEPVPDSALQAARYTLDQGVSVTNVTRVDLLTVKLGTTRMGDAKTYTLTINGVQDTATPRQLHRGQHSDPVQVLRLRAGCGGAQEIHRIQRRCRRSNPVNLFNDARFPDSPNRKELMAFYEYPASAVGRDAVADPARLYFDVLEGYFVPPANGNYVFFISFADRCWAYLSTDESAANKYQVLSVGGWSDPRNWVSSHDYSPSQARTDQCNNSQWPGALGPNTITLQGGKRYYFMVVHHDPSWCGGDWFAATYKNETAVDPNTGSAPTLTGNAIGAYLDPTIGSVTFSQNPTNVTIMAGGKATFSALASGSSDYTTTVTYQWQSALLRTARLGPRLPGRPRRRIRLRSWWRRTTARSSESSQPQRPSPRPAPPPRSP